MVSRRSLICSVNYSRLATGVECALESTKETLRSSVNQSMFLISLRRLTVLLECLNDVLELLSRCECVFTW